MAASSHHNILTLNYKNTSCYNAAADRENNYLGKKITEARHNSGLSLSAFKILLEDYGIDVTAPAINKWELGNSCPNAYQILAISQALNIEDGLSYFMSSSMHSQLNFEGQQKLASYRDDLIASGRYQPKAAELTPIKYRDMKVSSLPASAGTGAFLDEGNYEVVSFPESEIPAGAEFGIRVSGDSMEPVYHDGQIVWIQQCEELPVGTVGIFVYDGDGYIKVYGEKMPAPEIQEDFTDSYGNIHMQPVMISYNQKYAPREISANASFKIVGRVL